jgi:hypothetical protein
VKQFKDRSGVNLNFSIGSVVPSASYMDLIYFCSIVILPPMNCSTGMKNYLLINESSDLTQLTQIKWNGEEICL